MPTIRKRYQFKFWLDSLKSDEFELGAQLEALKKSRKYAGTIRDALKLLFSLRERKTDVLFSMFPWLVDELKPKNGNGAGEMTEHLNRIEQFFLQQSQNMLLNQGAPAGDTKPVGMGGLKAMNVSRIAAPVDDDDELDILIVPSTAPSNSARNFLNALSSI